MFFFLMQIVFVLFFYHVIDVLKSAGCYVHSDVAVSANKERVEFSSLLPLPFLFRHYNYSNKFDENHWRFIDLCSHWTLVSLTFTQDFVIQRDRFWSLHVLQSLNLVKQMLTVT